MGSQERRQSTKDLLAKMDRVLEEYFTAFPATPELLPQSNPEDLHPDGHNSPDANTASPNEE